MIAKHVPMRSVGKSNFADLANYICDSQGKDHRLGQVRVTNCESATLNTAIEEIMATQASNTRAQSDKTFHLIVSFRPGEEVSDDVLSAIEARICDGLGFGEHQRVSAVHNDTDNLHIHIAINKIHPQRRTIHEPYYSHRALADLCVTLEKDYQLEVDNHIPHQRGAAGRAEDMERHSGIESLVGWIKRECLEELRGAKSWEELHDVLSANGLELKPRGNGLVVEAENGVTIKASTLARDFSKPALEKKLGEFVAIGGEKARAKRSYKKAPLKSRIDTTELYARYKREQARQADARTEAMAAARAKKDRAVEDAKRGNRLRRATIKVIQDRSVSKRLLYGQAAAALKTKLDSIHKEYAREREQLYQGFKRETWADWLKSEAQKGNTKALDALRAREAAQKLKEARALKGEGKRHKPGHAPVMDAVTKKGTIIYRGGKTAVRDDGEKLQVSKEHDLKGLQEALVIASKKYGNRLTIEGDAQFKAKIIFAAVEAKLPITFADQGLERKRQELLIAKEKENDRRNERGRSDKRSAGSVGTGAYTFNRDAGGGRGRVDTHASSERRAGKPDVGRVGRKPPPESQHRLRELSALGLVQFTARSEVLLQGNVSGDVEQQGAESNNKLRRDVSGAGVKLGALAAADKYIAERESKRAKGFDITKHARYNKSDDVGQLAFAGLRNVEGHSLALLKREDETVMVMPVDAATARRLRRVKIGSVVSVTPKGSIRTTKGRSR